MASMRPKYIVCGLLLMLVDAYLDNIRGPILPVLSRALSLPYGLSSWFFAAGNFASVFCTFLMIPLSHRFGDRKLAGGICALGVVCALLGASVHGFGSLVVLAAIWGSTVAMFGTVANLLVLKGTDAARRARYFCGLHMMYGFGSVVAPGAVGAILGAGHVWYTPLLICSPVFVVMTGYFFLRFPREARSEAVEKKPFRLNRPQAVALFTFSFYVGAEVMASAWMVSYLVESLHLPLPIAARYLTGFFLAMGVTRALCFVSLPAALESIVLAGSLFFSGLFFTLGHLGFLWAFPLAGVLGPFFPLLLARVSRSFPEESHNLTIGILTCVQLTLVACHLALGGSTDRLGIDTAYWFPLPLLAVTLGSLCVYMGMETGVSIPGLPVSSRGGIGRRKGLKIPRS